ncbi:hypothetical protein HKX48_006352 [Thoreauomyces humboldtii]|nr:hypothetical protein HKX48_006352 [Thoreauomyces humboldtii]
MTTIVDPYDPSQSFVSLKAQYVAEILVAMVGIGIMVGNLCMASIVLFKRPRPYNAVLVLVALSYLGFQVALLLETLCSGTRSRLYLKQLDALPDTSEVEEREDWGFKKLMSRIERAYSILFAMATCSYLILIQSRFRVIRKGVTTRWNLWDYAFIFITIAICSTTIVTFNIILYRGESVDSDAASAIWSFYVLATDQILSGTFLYKLSKYTAFIGQSNIDNPPLTSSVATSGTTTTTTSTIGDTSIPTKHRSPSSIPLRPRAPPRRHWWTRMMTINDGPVAAPRPRPDRRRKERRRVTAALASISGISWLLCGIYVASHFGFQDDAGLENLVYRIAASFSALTCTFALVSFPPSPPPPISPPFTWCFSSPSLVFGVFEAAQAC